MSYSWLGCVAAQMHHGAITIVQDLQIPPEELTQRLQSSDREVFSQLFDSLHEPLLRYARRFTRDDATAYDLLQDVFVTLWERRQTLSIKTSIQAMLYTMVRNRALNMKRRDKWFDRESSVDDTEATDSAAAPDDVMEAAGLAKRLKVWIGEMPARRAEAFMLSRYHGLSHREIGNIMGVSERTVDTHILLALRELRARMEKLDA
ncbi:MAG: RNA polymerase sigma-70 factor [Rhodothermia bacterium]|nr:RNA polymerase sigma-70 factor [Rhodothermia bacterium]